MLVPDSIQTTNTTLSVNRDAYLNQLRNFNWGGDEGLRRPDEKYKLLGMKGNLYNELVAFLNIGIPHGRLISIKGLVLGGKTLEPHYTYHEVYR